MKSKYKEWCVGLIVLTYVYLVAIPLVWFGVIPDPVNQTGLFFHIFIVLLYFLFRDGEKQKEETE